MKNLMKKPPPNTLERAKYTRTQICIFLYGCSVCALPGPTRRWHNKLSCCRPACPSECLRNACGMPAQMPSQGCQDVVGMPAKAFRMLPRCCQNALGMRAECWQTASSKMIAGCSRNTGRLMPFCCQTNWLPDRMMSERS